MLCARGNNNAQTFIRVRRGFNRLVSFSHFFMCFLNAKIWRMQISTDVCLQTGCFRRVFFSAAAAAYFHRLLLFFRCICGWGEGKKWELFLLIFARRQRAALDWNVESTLKFLCLVSDYKARHPVFVILLVCFGFNLWVCHFSMTLCLLFFSY